MVDFLSFNEKVIAEFRENEGVCGGPFEGAPMILITMTGAKSGRSLTSPLVFSRDGDDPVIIASMGGAPNHPNWYHNLVANPTVTVEIPGETYEARFSLADTYVVSGPANVDVKFSASLEGAMWSSVR